MVKNINNDSKLIVKLTRTELEGYFKYGKKEDPLTSFYENLISNLPDREIKYFLSGGIPQVSNIKINREFYEDYIFEKVIKEYVYKQMEHYSDKSKEYALSMYDLDLGPGVLSEIPVGEIWLTGEWMV